MQSLLLLKKNKLFGGLLRYIEEQIHQSNRCPTLSSYLKQISLSSSLTSVSHCDNILQVLAEFVDFYRFAVPTLVWIIR